MGCSLLITIIVINLVFVNEIAPIKVFISVQLVATIIYYNIQCSLKEDLKFPSFERVINVTHFAA